VSGIKLGSQDGCGRSDIVECMMLVKYFALGERNGTAGQDIARQNFLVSWGYSSAQISVSSLATHTLGMSTFSSLR